MWTIIKRIALGLGAVLLAVATLGLSLLWAKRKGELAGAQKEGERRGRIGDRVADVIRSEDAAVEAETAKRRQELEHHEPTAEEIAELLRKYGPKR